PHPAHLILRTRQSPPDRGQPRPLVRPIPCGSPHRSRSPSTTRQSDIVCSIVALHRCRAPGGAAAFRVADIQAAYNYAVLSGRMLLAREIEQLWIGTLANQRVSAEKRQRRYFDQDHANRAVTYHRIRL